MLVGYARTSTIDQVAGFEAQEQALATSCNVEKLFKEQVSSIGHRPQLEAALDFVREGDTLVVTRIDRLARSTSDLLSIIQRLEAKKVALRVLDWAGDTVDTSTPAGRLMLTMTAAFSQFERELMLERQRCGIEAAKRAGKYKGRAPTARRKADDIRALRAAGSGASAIAGQLGISRSSVYRILAENGR